MSLQIPEPIARVLAQIPAELVHELAELIRRVVSSPDPKDTLARALQVAAHEKASDAAVEAMFEAKKRIPGSGV